MPMDFFRLEFHLATHWVGTRGTVQRRQFSAQPQPARALHHGLPVKHQPRKIAIQVVE